MVDLYGARPGTRLTLPLPDGRVATLFVRGVWRDYARQFGAVMLDAADYRRLTGDTRVNDLALWLQPGTDAAALQQRLRALAAPLGLRRARSNSRRPARSARPRCASSTAASR